MNKNPFQLATDLTLCRAVAYMLGIKKRKNKTNSLLNVTPIT